MEVVHGEIQAPWDYGVGFPMHHSEVYLLDAINAHKNANAGELAKQLGISNAAVSQVAKKLIGKKLAETYQIAENHKEIFFRLTSLGKKAAAGHRKHHKKIYADFFDYYKRLNESDIAAIANFLDTVGQSILCNRPDVAKKSSFRYWIRCFFGGDI
jgi:DNA-binding MarR family transcriptional regulator